MRGSLCPSSDLYCLEKYFAFLQSRFFLPHFFISFPSSFLFHHFIYTGLFGRILISGNVTFATNKRKGACYSILARRKEER